MGFRGNEVKRRKVGTIARGIPCQQPVSSPLGMGTDEKVRKGSLPLATGEPIETMRLAGSKRSLEGYGFALHVEPGQGDRQVLLAQRRSSEFRPDHRADNEITLSDTLFQQLCGPLPLGRCRTEDIDEDVGINEGRRRHADLSETP